MLYAIFEFVCSLSLDFISENMWVLWFLFKLVVELLLGMGIVFLGSCNCFDCVGSITLSKKLSLNHENWEMRTEFWVRSNQISLKYSDFVFPSKTHTYTCVCVCVCVYVGWVKVTPGVTLNNVTPSNNLLFNSYFENPTVELYVLYVLNMHVNFHANWI